MHIQGSDIVISLIVTFGTYAYLAYKLWNTYDAGAQHGLSLNALLACLIGLLTGLLAFVILMFLSGLLFGQFLGVMLIIVLWVKIMPRVARGMT